MRRWMLGLVLSCVMVVAGAADRQARVQAALPELDQSFMTLAEKEHIPGLVWGVVVDGKLVHVRSAGVADIGRKEPVTPQTAFRIASMTKSFVAMAILRLRDEGKLRLDDPVGRYLPEARHLKPSAGDAPLLTLRHLLTMSAGLPEDNPWGDRQMGISRAELGRLLNGGLSFSTVPGGPYEYSNLGYIMLGQVVAQVSGMRFQDYITQFILRPLGMRDTVWEYDQVPAGRLAIGYQWLNGQWSVEPILHDGGGAAMGGLITTMEDFGRYVGFLLDAWPARSDPEPGPLRRASVREMADMHKVYNLTVNGEGKAAEAIVTGYGYGLRNARTSHDVVLVGHAGGLPGYGSQYWLSPERGVALIAFGNLRYAPVYTPVRTAILRLVDKADIGPRAPAPSPILLQRREQVLQLLQGWDEKLAQETLAMNFFLDRSRADWIAASKAALDKIGPIVSASPIRPENALRGSFDIVGEKGKLEVHFTLSPEKVARVQALELRP